MGRLLDRTFGERPRASRIVQALGLDLNYIIPSLSSLSLTSCVLDHTILLAPHNSAPAPFRCGVILGPHFPEINEPPLLGLGNALPRVLEAKPSAGGLRYYWNAPSWARKRDFPITLRHRPNWSRASLSGELWRPYAMKTDGVAMRASGRAVLNEVAALTRHEDAQAKPGQLVVPYDIVLSAVRRPR